MLKYTEEQIKDSLMTLAQLTSDNENGAKALVVVLDYISELQNSVSTMVEKINEVIKKVEESVESDE